MSRFLAIGFLLLPQVVFAEYSTPDLGIGVDPSVAAEIITLLKKGLVLSNGEYIIDRLESIDEEQIESIELSSEGYEVTVGRFPGCKKILELRRRCDVKRIECSWYNSPEIRHICT